MLEQKRRAHGGCTMNAEEIWSQALVDLKGAMTRATFSQWVSGTQGVALKDDELVVAAPGALAKEWLESRLAQTVERAVAGVAERPLRVSYVVPAPDANVEDDARSGDAVDSSRPIDVEGVYENRRAELLKPDRIAPITQYFRKQWVPILGPMLAWVIVDLRQRAYWNKHSGERRDQFFCTLTDIAISLGVTDDTIWRSLKRECGQCETPHPVADHFILKREPRYEERSGKLVCTGTAWKIRLDDPLTPKDERELRESPEPQNRG